tara:strand:+ start:677 stop:1186 length:510 start_codon:yes stop_codon:yes gene_type:complete
MEESIKNKPELKNRLANLYKNNKPKIYVFLSILLVSLITFSYLKYNNEKKNITISEKYIKAGLFLSSQNLEKSKVLYEEIIYSKNSFYGILALNTILEKNLISDKEKILDLFQILITSKLSQEQIDIINLKKSLFLIKNSDFEKGKKILEELIENKSKLKSLAEEIIKK